MSTNVGSTTTPIIDVHVHTWNDDFAPRILELFLNSFPIDAYSDGTLDGWIRHMDESGVDLSVIQPVPTKPKQVEVINEWMTSLLDSERFMPFAGVHPDHADPAGVIHRAAEAGFKGIKLHPLNQDFRPQEARMSPIYDAAIEENMVILFHAGAGMDYDAIRGSKEDFDAFFDKYPYDRVILAHLGGRADWQHFPELKSGWPGYLDCSYTMNLMPDETFIDIVRDFGTDRVLFGTDGPWRSEKEDIAKLKTLGFSEDELVSILYKNAAELLNISLPGSDQ